MMLRDGPRRNSEILDIAPRANTVINALDARGLHRLLRRSTHLELVQVDSCTPSHSSNLVRSIHLPAEHPHRFDHERRRALEAPTHVFEPAGPRFRGAAAVKHFAVLEP